MLEGIFIASSDSLLRVFVSTTAIFVTVITYTRIAGLRSFSKMSSFDFAMTVAVGSLIATVAVTQTTIVEGMIALAALYLSQISIAYLRRYRTFKKLIDNKPVLLMREGKMLHNAMREARITEHDIKSKLRESNVMDMQSVRAVVLETTGDITVLHGKGPLDPALLEGVEKP